jgi:hypothetical protein
VDRRDPAGDKIVTDELLRECAMHHLLMRRALGQVGWNRFPASILILEALESEDPKKNFDYFDGLDEPFLCIRIGSALVVAFLQDFGATAMLDFARGGRLAIAQGLKLHPLQCSEMMAFFYTLLKLHYPANVIVGRNGTPDEPHWDVHCMPLGGLSGRPPFADWDEDLFHRVIAEMFERRHGIELGIDGATFLVDRHGDPIQAPSADWEPDEWG